MLKISNLLKRHVQIQPTLKLVLNGQNSASLEIRLELIFDHAHVFSVETLYLVRSLLFLVILPNFLLLFSETFILANNV